MTDYEALGRRLEEVGYPILSKFNQMTDEVLKETLKVLFTTYAKQIDFNILNSVSVVTRVIVNMKITSITIGFSEQIVISNVGIWYAHYNVRNEIFEFNEHFHIPVIGGTKYNAEDVTIG